MSVDKILSEFVSEEEKISRKAFHESLIKKSFYHPKKSKVLYIFIPQMSNFKFFTNKLRRLMKKKGCSFLEYSISPMLLTPDPKQVKSNFMKIKARIIKDIESLNKRYGFNEINLIGISIGCVSACLVANRSKIIKILFLIVPGNNLTESLWHGVRTRTLRSSYRKQKIYLHNLKSSWRGLDPENNINHLNEKNLHIFLSKADGVIPYHNGHKFLEELHKQNYEVVSNINKSKGHYLTALDFYLNPRKYLSK